MKFRTVIGTAQLEPPAFIPNEIGQRYYVDIFTGTRKDPRSIAMFDTDTPCVSAPRSVMAIPSASTRTSYGLLKAYEKDRLDLTQTRHRRALEYVLRQGGVLKVFEQNHGRFQAWIEQNRECVGRGSSRTVKGAVFSAFIDKDKKQGRHEMGTLEYPETTSPQPNPFEIPELRDLQFHLSYGGYSVVLHTESLGFLVAVSYRDNQDRSYFKQATHPYSVREALANALNGPAESTLQMYTTREILTRLQGTFPQAGIV